MCKFITPYFEACLKMLIAVMLLVLSSSVYADKTSDSGSSSLPTAAPSEQSMASAATQSAEEGEEKKASQAGYDANMDELNASFAEVAALGQKISLANKKIQAMQLQKQLDRLQTSSSQKSLGFRILRIEGFGSVLYAVLQTDSGGIIQVGPGEQVNDQYRVALITSNSVKVYSDGKVYTVPFYTPVTGTGNERPSSDDAVEQRQQRQ